MRRNQIMRLAAIEIYNEIGGFWLWPLATPDIDAVIDRSMRRVARLVSKDYRAPVKVQCCGFTLMRCCCRKKRKKNDAVDNIFKDMEKREGELMEARGLTDYMEKGDNEFGGYLLEDDAYSAERRLTRRRDDDDTEYSYSTRGQSYSSGSYSRDDSRSVYSRSAYSRDASRSSYTRDGYLEDGSVTEYSRSRGGSYSKDSSALPRIGAPTQKVLEIENGDSYSQHSYSRASQSRGGSVYTEDGDSFTKEVAASIGPSRSRPASSANRHTNNTTSRRSRAEFSQDSSSYNRGSIHWDEASDSQYSSRR